MNRNIEAGCMAMLIDAEKGHEGAIGSVGIAVKKHVNPNGTGFILNIESGESIRMNCSELWELAGEGFTICAEEHALLRIDNYEDSAETTTQEEEMTV